MTSEPQQVASLNWRTQFQEADSLPSDSSGAEKAKRGRNFERILHAMLDEAGLSPRTSYRPKGEEVDGSFIIHGRTMLLEAKWTQGSHPASSLYQFRGKIEGKLAGTIGIFISMGGFSADAIDALIAGKHLNLILADGEDIRMIAGGVIGIKEAIELKLRAAAESGTPYLPLTGIRRTTRRIFITEGPFDTRVLESILRVFGMDQSFTTLAAGGPGNIAPLARALVTEIDKPTHFVLIIDGEGLYRKAEQDINNRIESEIDSGSATLIRLEPDLDTALGLVDHDSSWEERNRLRRLTDSRLDLIIQQADLPRRAKENPAVATLLNELGVQY